MSEEEQTFYQYCVNYYNIYDMKQELENQLSKLNPHIQNMLDRGFFHIVDKVILDRQKS